MGSKRGGAISSQGREACKAFLCSPTQLQAWEGKTEMGGASLFAHHEGLTLGNDQKHTPHTRVMLTLSGVEQEGSSLVRFCPTECPYDSFPTTPQKCKS